MKKYEFTGETKTIETLTRLVTLHRIKAIAEFGNVKTGELGGWIEKEGNLSNQGNAWVYDDAMVYGNARVCGNARVYDDARVYGNAWVYDDARVYGNARVCGNARVYGDARVCGNARVYGDAWVCGDGEIFQPEHVVTIGAIGSRNDFTTFFRDRDNEITVKCGCFHGKIEEFLEKVNMTHKDTKHALVYRAAVEVAKLQIDLGTKRTPQAGDESVTEELAEETE